MATEVTLPSLGESVTEGIVTRWLKQVGDTVEVDEALLEVSTDKVDTEIPSPVSGTLLEIRANEDDTIEIGAVLALIGDENESTGAGTDSGSDDSGAEGTQEQAPAEAAAEQPSEEQPAEEQQPAAEEPAAEQQQQDQGEQGGLHDQGDQQDHGDQGDQGDQGEYPASQDEAAPAAPPAEQQGETTDQPAAEQAEEDGGQASDEQAEAGQGSGDQPDDGQSDQRHSDQGQSDQGQSDEGQSGGGARTPVTLPSLGESVTEGTITRWLKQVGDAIEVDEPLVEVSTDKVDTEIPSPVAGTLLEQTVAEDETVEIGAQLAVIGTGDASSGGAEQAAPDQEQAPEQAAQEDQQEQQQAQENVDESDTVSAPAEEQAQPEQAQPEPQDQPQAEQPQAEQPQDEQAQDEQAQAASGGGDVAGYVTPLVRKLASQHGVDLATISGTGVGGRIRKQDVIDAAQRSGTVAPVATPPAASGVPAAPAATPSAAAAATETESSPLRGQVVPMTRLRKVIAKRMIESLQTSAQLTTVIEVDVTGISRLRDARKEEFLKREGVKLSFMPFFAKAAVDALKSFPMVNASIDTEKGEVTYYDRENLAIAVDTEKGLLSPVIKDAGDLSVAGLARKIADVADRTRNNQVTPDELGGGTFTLTNTGSRGALFDTPIINQPQVAILGTGAVVKRPVVIDDANLGETIAVRQMVYLALTYDHRLVDGADAARFLADVKARLEAAQFDV